MPETWMVERFCGSLSKEEPVSEGTRIWGGSVCVEAADPSESVMAPEVADSF
jgi:hypothetical protein